MQGYYDTEFQPETKRADVERELARVALVDAVGAVRRSGFREQMAVALLAVAARLAPPARHGPAEGPATGASRA